MRIFRLAAMVAPAARQAGMAPGEAMTGAYHVQYGVLRNGDRPIVQVSFYRRRNDRPFDSFRGRVQPADPRQPRTLRGPGARRNSLILNRYGSSRGARRMKPSELTVNDLACYNRAFLRLESCGRGSRAVKGNRL